MTKKRTKLLLFLLTLTIIATMFAMIACTDDTPKPNPGDDDNPPTTNDMTFAQYMNKINAGLKSSESELSSATAYHVTSEYTVYTREENLTLEYAAVYNENRRDGKYQIRIFDNNEHFERLNAYYDSSDLYVTVKDEHYVIEDFGTLLIFDTFDAFLDLLDLGELVYGNFMQTNFSETTPLSAIIGVRNLGYVKTGETKERVTVSNVDLGMLMGQINAQIAAWKNRFGTVFDSVTDHYLGFSFSRLLEMTFASLDVKNIDFTFEDGKNTATEAEVSGRMQDNTRYFVTANYAYDYTTTKITDAESLPDDYVYAAVTPGQGSFAGKTTLPDMRDSDFDFSLDYNLNAKDNKENEFTVRMYDQLSSSDRIDESHKYDNINEIISAYYDDEILYVNTAGAYDYIGTTVALNALRLPKIYFTGFNASGVMSLAYTDMLQIINLLMTPPEETTAANDRLIDSVIAAIESDVSKKEIRITITEALIKQIRGDDTDLAVLLGEMLGVDSETILRYFGNDFFQLMRIVVRYNFGTGVLGIDIYNGTDLIMSTDMENAGYNGITMPHDLNELNYTEFKEPELVTVTYDIELNPYGAESVSVSEFIGAFIGDATGKNTPYALTTGHYLTVRGRMSEYYVTDASGQRQPVTTMDLRFLSTAKGTGEETLIMTLTTNPFDVGQLLVGLYTEVGDYDGSDGGIRYSIDREKVSEQLEKLTDGENIFAGNTGLSAFLAIYNAAEKNSKSYTEDGYFCVDLTVTDENDPVNELVGIENTNARIKCKIEFDALDLSGVNADAYGDPYVHIPEDVSATSIYSNGSKWKDTAYVTVSGKRIGLKVTYKEDTIKIETGKNDYNPAAEIFGKEYGYALHIVSVTGTYVVKSVSINGDLLVVDPAFSKTLPKEIGVMYEGGETGTLACAIEDFPESRVTPDGYNLALLAGVTDGIEKHKLVIGKDSIASIEKEIYVAVINRRIIPQEDSSGNDMYYVAGKEQIPVVAEYDADPYTYAMTKRLRREEGEEYDYLTEQLNLNRNTLQFENLYGYETVTNPTTGEEEHIPLYYNAEGYNWLYLHTAGLDWAMSEDAFSWRGETRYAVATYGDEENGYAMKIAIKVNVKSKIVRGVKIDGYDEGTYTVDYLKEETYVIPSTTASEHTVRVYFEDNTNRIVSLTRPAILGDDEYCATYVYGELLWADSEGIGDRLDVQGTTGLFGSGTNATNVTTASFGGDVADATQTVELNVVAPSRYISASDTVNMSLVTQISEDGVMGSRVPTQVTKAQFNKPVGSGEEILPFSINPYNTQACLPDTIWLYVPVTMSESGRKEWTEYPVQWLTTDKPASSGAEAKELNIIKLNENGKYVLAHPVTEETPLVVYGVVGNAYGHTITVTMSILNLASDIKSYELYLNSGEKFDTSVSAAVDPYLDYSANIPTRFVAVLGSGQDVEGETDWYVDGLYPLIRSGEFLGSEYDGMYSEKGYYIFPREGGSFQLEMTVAAGEVRNTLYLSVSVDSRDILAYYETTNDSITRVSDYVDIYATGMKDGEVYAGEPAPGYTNINYYSADSSAFLRRINALIENGGVGVAGFAFEQTGRNNLYAKTVAWNAQTLESIAKALRKDTTVTRTFRLAGTINKGTVNETTVTVLISIDDMTASIVDVGLTRSEDMRLKNVYSIANDLDGDGRISLTYGGEGKNLVDAAYYRNEQYKAYFGSDEGYTDLDFANVIYFEIDKVHMLSSSASGTYTSPYDYFVYLFDNLELRFTSDKTVKATAKNAINLNGRSAEFFNSALLGLNESVIDRDEQGRAVCYAFMILEKLSEGSAIDRTLVIVTANKANATELQREDKVDALGEDLTELYPERFDLPGVIEIVYEKEDGSGSYTARYVVDAWTPTLNYFGSLAPISAIEARYINIIDGCSYGFSFVLPDMEEADNLVKTFYYTVEFRKKDVGRINYDASARSSVYDIDGGKIYIVNSYSFLTRDVTAPSGREYVFNTAAVPSTLAMRTGTGSFQAGDNDNYTVRWNFTDNAAFGEDIFAKGTVDDSGENNGVLIATYTFDSYYRNGEHQTQTLELYLVLEPMEFYAIESDEFTVVAGNEEGENERLNTIVIDPYGNTSYNGNLILPTDITLAFNGTRTYDFTGAVYMLTDERGTPMREISNVPYGEKGHKLIYDYTSDPTLLRLKLYVRGYSRDLGTGIDIKIRFLQRTITDSRIPNATYNDDGTFVYEKETSGSVVMENGEPKKATYHAYADYVYTYENGGYEYKSDGKMPVYYIDPYNSATFGLPTKAAFEFAETAVGVYVEYGITGWQYYDVETKTYKDFAEIAKGSTPGKRDRFYQTLSSDEKSYRCYFNPNGDSYKGAYYPLRGYITVGDENQYFEIICVVLNRSLRASVMLKDEYTVSYDFADPIAAMLSDIPAMFGADAFVDYDRYNDKFSVSVKNGNSDGVYAFTIAESDHFSRKQNGTATNCAVVPELLWNEEYDTDGDGIPDTLFDELTTKGFTGVIDGNLYYGDGNLNALFDYYEIKVKYDYDRLVAALMWDTLFAADGSVSVEFSATASNAITAEKAVLEREVIHAAYDIMLAVTGTEEEIAAGTALSDENKLTLTDSILEVVLQEINRQQQISGGKEYDPSDEEDMIYIAYCMYLDVKEEYDAWTGSRGEKTAKTEICEVWDYYIERYRSQDVSSSANISGNQLFKAKHFLNIFNADGTLNTQERSSLTSAMNTLMSSLYISRNVDLWQEVYENANPIERAVMDGYASRNATAGNASLGLSVACDLFKAERESLTELGTKGEGATADISIPLINFDSILIEGSTDSIIHFNKFNFASVDKQFTVRFELSYEEIYQKMIEEAKENAIKNFRDDKKSESLAEFEEKAIREAVDAIAPKERNEDGTYEVIPGMKKGSKSFGYDMWIEGRNESDYSGFWNALVTYRYNDAVKIITANVASVGKYDDLANDFEVSVTEVALVEAALKMIKASLIAEAIIERIEKENDFETAAGRRAGVRAVAMYVQENNSSITSLFDAYEAIGLNSGFAGDDNYDVTDEMWNTVVFTFVNEAFSDIVEEKINAIEYAYPDKTTKLADRRGIIRAIAEYIVGEDAEISRLNGIYEIAEGKRRAALAEVLLRGSSSNSNIQNAARAAGNGDEALGYAVMFDIAYRDIVDSMYAFIKATDGVGNVEGGAMAILENTYAANPRKNGIIAYFAMVSRDDDLRNAAEFYFTFLTEYAKGRTSPYDKLMENPAPSGFTATQIESYGNGETGSDCLLYYAEPESKYSDAVIGNASGLAMTESEIRLALKKMTLYDVLYARASTQNQNIMNAQAEEAREEMRTQAMNRLFAANEIVANYLRAYYNGNTTTNVAYYAFVALVEEEMATGTEKGTAYEKFETEYVVSNEYICSREMLEAMKAQYEINKNLQNSSLTSFGYIANEIYGIYLENPAYLTIDNYGDDRYDEGYLASELAKIIENKNISSVNTENAINGYMKDALMRALVYYYDNVADESQKEIVAEVSEMYIGVNVNGDLEKAYIGAASSGRATGSLGISIYHDLLARNDLGTGAEEEINACFYTVWLNTVMGGAKYVIETLSIDEMNGRAPFTSNSVLVGAIIEQSGGSTAGAADTIANIAAGMTKKTMLTQSAICVGYDDAYNNIVLAGLAEGAKKYAYDKMYEAKTERGSYAYREELDDILEQLVGEGSELDELIFDEAQSEELASKLDVMENAALKAIRTLFYAEVYDSIKLLGLSAEEFAAKAYKFVTGKDADEEGVDAAVELFGENKNGAGGIVYDIVNEFIVNNGELIENGTNAGYIELLTEWWNTDGRPEEYTMYGRLGKEEQEILANVQKQAYYQTNDLTTSASLTLEARNKIAYASMLTSLYLFLRDSEDEISAMPADYFSAGNEDEYKAYVVSLMLDGDLMKNDAHSLSLAQAALKAICASLAYDKAMYFARITGEGALDASDVTLEAYLIKISKAVIRANGVIPSTASGDTTEDREKVFYKYLEKAVGYVEYTSVLGADEYNRGADIRNRNPLRDYADAIYIAVTGYDMHGVSYIEGETTDSFGMTSFGKLLADAGGDYAAALASITGTRLVSANDFVSEDHATENDRHVIFFDRAEWDGYLTESGDYDANAYYTNKNIFIGNPGKTQETEDVSGGNGYSNTIKATGFEYRLSDFTTIDLYFETDESNPYDEEKQNLIMLDALSPELPDEAYAIGYVRTTDAEYGIRLGKIAITEYSDEFYKLVYKATEPEEDAAYQITLKTAGGYIYKKIGGIKVGYLDRNVDKIYLETGAYTEGRARPETSGDFVNMYCIYDSSTTGATAGKNVIYIDPTAEDLLLVSQRKYVLPGTIAIECGEGEKVVFTEVEWNMSGVTYNLKGTGAAGRELRVNSYKYVDEDGNTRHISYNFSNSTVTMNVYDKDSGQIVSTAEYILSADDMIEWNTVLVIGDRSLQSVNELTEDGIYQQIATVGSDGIADATTLGKEINPYYPEYPTQLQLNLAGDSKLIELTQSDWTPDLTKLNQIKRGEVGENGDYTFTAAFNYLGYEIRMKFLAMEIQMPKGTTFEGGTIYLVRGEGDVKTQFEKNYGTAYFNFNEEENGTPNWQKVPVALKNYNDVRISEEGVQRVEGIIGGTGIGDIEANAWFDIRVITLSNYAVLDGEFNVYSTYDYYSVPADGNKKANGSGESPAQMGETYIYIDESGTRHVFTASNADLEYDFINKTVTVSAFYELGEETSERISYNASGDRVRSFVFGMEMKNYERSGVSEPEFDTDDTGKKWTWTDIPKTSPRYTDAIYWRINTELKASDLPTVTDKASGITFNLMWDLSGLNVNRANVSVPGEINDGDGTVIYGYYMLRNGIWQSLALTVYIEKIDVTNAVIGFVKDNGEINTATYLEKTYDAQYYELPFDAEADGMRFLREDGSFEVIPSERYVVEYCVATDDEGLRVWSTTNLPLDAGEYYIRVRFIEEDYNVYISYTDGYLFRLTIRPYTVDMSGLQFEKEDNNTITQVYGATNAYLNVIAGLPSFTPANWFTPGEKIYLFNKYRATYSSDERAKSEVYSEIYRRVSDRMKEIIDGWYAEGRNALLSTEGFDDLSDDEQGVVIKAWVYDNRMDQDLKVVEAKIVINYYYDSQLLEYAPTDCGNYTVEILLDSSDGNYVAGDRAKNLILHIERDEGINYSIANTSLIYNGRAQNPEISGLHKNGTVPYGVKVTYVYSIGNDTLVVIVEGIKDDKGNVINKVSIDTSRTTVSNPLSGIKDAGSYICSVDIEGGRNYISGALHDVAIGVSPANVYINLADITRKYLSSVADLEDYLRVYDRNGVLQTSDVLLGNDKLSDLGVALLTTPVGRHYKVGTYYTYIEGFRTSRDAAYAYTELSGTEIAFNGETYTLLALKGYESEGSLYRDSEGNAALIKMFGNYNLFVRTHGYADGIKAAGTYRIEQEDGSDGVSGNEELAAYIAGIKDNDVRIVYLAPMTDANGDPIAYDPITINVAANITIVGYRNNAGSESEAEIETRIKGIRVLKGTVTLKIVSVEASGSGQTAVYIGDNAGYVTITESKISKTGNAENTVGVVTSVNFKERLFVSGVTFEGLSLALELVGGELEIEESNFVRNYNGVAIRMESGSVSIKTTVFSNTTRAAISSVSDGITVRNNTFEYNGISLDLPEGSTIRTNVNNNNVYENNGDDDLYE